jgi:hypothetical protein
MVAITHNYNVNVQPPAKQSQTGKTQRGKCILFYQRNFSFFPPAKGKDVKRVPREVSKLVTILKLNGNEK